MEGHYTVPVGKPTRISTQPRGLGASFDRVASYRGWGKWCNCSNGAGTGDGLGLR